MNKRAADPVLRINGEKQELTITVSLSRRNAARRPRLPAGQVTGVIYAGNEYRLSFAPVSVMMKLLLFQLFRERL